MSTPNQYALGWTIFQKKYYPNGFRVGITGVHGSGKTTLANELANAFSTFELPLNPCDLGDPSISRRLAKDFFQLARPQDLPEEQRNAFQWAGLGLQMADVLKPLKPDTFVRVFDRTPLDWWAYALDYTQRSDNPELVAGLQNGEYYRTAHLGMRAFNLIVHLPPPAWGVVDDGVRNTTETVGLADNISLGLKLLQTERHHKEILYGPLPNHHPLPRVLELSYGSYNVESRVSTVMNTIIHHAWKQLQVR